MLIVSKFKDYYDSAAAYGVDKKIVFKRKNHETEYKFRSKDSRSEAYSKMFFIDSFFKTNVKYYFIYLAGEIYTYAIIAENFTYNPNNVYFIHTEEQFNELRDELRPIISRDIFDDEKKDKVQAVWDNLVMMKKDLTEKYKDELQNILVDHDAVYFSGGMRYLLGDDSFLVRVLIHPILSDIKFGKVVSAPELFTKIEQYVSSLNNRDDVMVEISDKDKAVARGHDGKYSFKTPPKGKK